MSGNERFYGRNHIGSAISACRGGYGEGRRGKRGRSLSAFGAIGQVFQVDKHGAGEWSSQESGCPRDAESSTRSGRLLCQHACVPPSWALSGAPTHLLAIPAIVLAAARAIYVYLRLNSNRENTTSAPS